MNHHHLDPETTITMPVVVPTSRAPDDPEPADAADISAGFPAHVDTGADTDDDASGRFTPNPWRRRVADRLILAGRRHTRHRTDLAGTTRQPGPHALIFLHHEPDPRATDPRSGTVAIATRMFLNGDDLTDLTTILTELHARALDDTRAGVRHPIAQLVDTAEPMTRSARYLGLATSTNHPGPHDGPGSWPWQGLAQLTDGTRMIIRGTSSVATPDMQSTHTFDPEDLPLGILDAFDPGRAWRWTRPDLRDSNPDLAAQQDALDALHALIQATETQPRRHRRGAPARRS